MSINLNHYENELREEEREKNERMRREDFGGKKEKKSKK